MKIEEISIETKEIKLDQFLKWINLVSTGGEAKFLIKAGDIKVNGEIEERRGRALQINDVVEYNNIKYKIIPS